MKLIYLSLGSPIEFSQVFAQIRVFEDGQDLLLWASKYARISDGIYSLYIPKERLYAGWGVIFFCLFQEIHIQGTLKCQIMVLLYLLGWFQPTGNHILLFLTNTAAWQRGCGRLFLLLWDIDVLECIDISDDTMTYFRSLSFLQSETIYIQSH